MDFAQKDVYGLSTERLACNFLSPRFLFFFAVVLFANKQTNKLKLTSKMKNFAS